MAFTEVINIGLCKGGTLGSKFEQRNTARQLTGRRIPLGKEPRSSGPKRRTNSWMPFVPHRPAVSCRRNPMTNHHSSFHFRRLELRVHRHPPPCRRWHYSRHDVVGESAAPVP